MGDADLINGDRGFTGQVITDAHRPAPVMLLKVSSRTWVRTSGSFPLG